MPNHIKSTGFLKDQHVHPIRSKRRFPWVLGLVFGLVAVLIVLALQQKYSPESFSSLPSDFKVEVTGAPKIAVRQDSIDYGDQHYNVPVESVFALGNVGDQPLKIIGQPQVEVVEGCCPPRTNLTTDIIQPGEQAHLSMSFSMHAGMDGKHHFRVHVRTNDPVEPEKLLHVYSNWIP
jgi:hypothetical protein